MNKNTNRDDFSILRTKIKNELIDPSIYDDTKYNLRGRSHWKYIGDITEVISKILIGISSITAFAAGSFGNKYLSFVAGCLGVMSLVSLQFSSYSMKESKERNDIVNKLLTHVGLDNMVDIAPDPLQVQNLEINHIDQSNQNINEHTETKDK